MFASNTAAHEMKPCFAGVKLANGVACLEVGSEGITEDEGENRLAGGFFRVRMKSTLQKRLGNGKSCRGKPLDCSHLLTFKWDYSAG